MLSGGCMGLSAAIQHWQNPALGLQNFKACLVVHLSAKDV
jgi:hypothetical protein